MSHETFMKGMRLIIFLFAFFMLMLPFAVLFKNVFLR